MSGADGLALTQRSPLVRWTGRRNPGWRGTFPCAIDGAELQEPSL